MPINIDKHIQYWKKGAEEDNETAQMLFKRDKYKEALFYSHLSLEKAIKAHVVKKAHDIPPYSHDLPLLAARTDLDISSDKVDFLSKMNKYTIKGRYPDMERPKPSPEIVASVLNDARELIEWLIKQL